jgi:hypothetical protein
MGRTAATNGGAWIGQSGTDESPVIVRWRAAYRVGLAEIKRWAS